VFAASALGKKAAKADLVEDAEPAEGFYQEADREAEHGGATVEAFGSLELFLMGLADGGGLKPLTIGLEVRSGHGGGAL